MEGEGSNEQGFDEIEMLLGEIPNATSHAKHIIPANISSVVGTISIEANKAISSSCQLINSYNYTQSAKNEENMTYFGSLAFSGISVNQIHRSNEMIDDRNNGYEARALNNEWDVSNLPFESSLASAFEDLSFQDNVVAQPINPLLVKYNQTPPNHSSLNNSQSLFGRDTLEMFVPPLNQPMNQGIVDSHGYNGAMPLNPRAFVYDLLPNVPVQGIGLTTSPYQQQFLDARVPTFTLPQHIGRSNMEEEMYHRLQQQYLYQQHIHNHMSEVVQFRKNMNSTENQVPPYYEIPSDPRSSWYDNVVHNGHPQFDISEMDNGLRRYHLHGSCGKVRSCEFPRKNQGCNSKNFHEHQILDKFGNPYYPEKILTRSHGVNSLQSLRQNSFTTNRSSSISNNNRRYLSHGHGNHSIVKNNTSVQSQSSSSDSLESIASSSILSRSIEVNYNSVDEVLGRIYYLAKEQHGCRFLQRKFMEGCKEDVNKIFGEIIGHIVELMTDPFGNYLIQKMLEVCTEDQRMQIILAITKETGMLMRISCNMHGTRAVQKVIESLCTTEQVYLVLSSLKPGIVSLIKDINGNHVAQRCLQYFSPEQSEFLFDAAISHCVEIAMDRQGCCVLQKCVYHSRGDQRNRLLSAISSYSLVLSQDPFGNYVVQYVLDQKVPWVIASILDQLEGNYGSLSMQKHSSNVVEKCLKLSKEEDHAKIIQELMNSPRFLQILQDAYGNFVIQSALKQCKGALNAALLDAIKPHVPALRNHPYGKKVLSSASLKK